MADVLHMFPPFFRGLVVHILGQAGLQYLCLAVWLWGQLLSCAHVLVHFL